MKTFDEIPKNFGKMTFSEVANEYGIDQNLASFLPGRFYSLKIQPTSPDLNEMLIPEINDGKPYYDVNPTGLVLFHENWKEQTLVLNLRVLPPRVSDGLLRMYYEFSKKNGLINLYEKDELKPLNERKLLDQRFYMVTPSMLSDMLRIHNLDYAINKYNTDSIMEAKLIDWDNFGMLVNPTITPKGFFPIPFNIVRVFEEFLQKSLE